MILRGTHSPKRQMACATLVHSFLYSTHHMYMIKHKHLKHSFLSGSSSKAVSCHTAHYSIISSCQGFHHMQHFTQHNTESFLLVKALTTCIISHCTAASAWNWSKVRRTSALFLRAARNTAVTFCISQHLLRSTLVHVGSNTAGINIHLSRSTLER